MPNLIVGTAGHIDHGKSALVKALTGIDPDRLKEEKERGITIDIGFANLLLDSETSVAFIDVPGHERFIKNMLAGAAGVDVVMLIVAAGESVMPQTREHLDICSLLRVRHGFTVLTKIDTVDPEIADVAEHEVREFLKGSFLEESAIVRASAVTGEGVSQITRILREYAHKVRPKDASLIFRLPIDRCFTTKGFGTVVTGTLIAGRIRKGDEVQIHPSGKISRVRGIQVHGRASPEAVAGQRTALNLQDVEVAEIERGMVATTPGLLTPSSVFDCHLELLRSAPKALPLRKRIRFHIGTAERIGYVVLLGQDRLAPGESAFVQVRLEQPVLASPSDRFILRQYSPMITIAGGQILDAHPEKHRTSDERVFKMLRILKDGTIADRLTAFVERAGLQTTTLPAMVRWTGLPEAAITPELDRNRIRIVQDHPIAAMSKAAFDEAVLRTKTELRRFHESNPLTLGPPLEDLKNRALGDNAPHAIFKAVLDQLTEDRAISVAGEIVHEFGRTVQLNSNEERIRETLANRFESFGFQTPPPGEIIDELKLNRGAADKLVQLLVKENVLVKINEEFIVHHRHIDELIEGLRARKAIQPKLNVAQFKDLVGVTRKWAIPLLEYLDRRKVTRRLGEERIVL